MSIMWEYTYVRSFHGSMVVGLLILNLLDKAVGFCLQSLNEKFILIPLLIFELLDVEWNALANGQMRVSLHEVNDLTFIDKVGVCFIEPVHLLNYNYQISMALQLLKYAFEVLFVGSVSSLDILSLTKGMIVVFWGKTSKRSHGWCDWGTLQD